MNTKAQSLRNGGWLLGVVGLVLIIVGVASMGAIDGFNATLGICLALVGTVLMLAGLIYGGLAITVREPAEVESIVPQPSPQPYYPPQS